MKIKFKHILIVFIFGMFITGIGALMKILSWPYGTESLLLGNVFYGIAALTLMVKLILFKDESSILNK